MDDYDFSGKVAILTGGASGMALLTGQELAKRGANVVLADYNGAAAEKCAAEINALGGGRALGVEVDVRKYERIDACVKKTVGTFGVPDYLMNSAGGASGRIFHQFDRPFYERSIESIEWGIDVNIKGAILFVRAVLGLMIEKKRGVIINMGSIDGVTGGTCLDYTAAKIGMSGITKGIAKMGAPYNVRSVCVAPGPVLTRPGMAGMPTLLGRAAEPIELVNFILYMLSDKAAFITGSTHLVDGGRACMV